MRKLQNGETFCGFSGSATIRARKAKNKNKRIAKRAYNYLFYGRRTENGFNCKVSQHAKTSRFKYLCNQNGSTGNRATAVANKDTRQNGRIFIFDTCKKIAFYLCEAVFAHVHFFIYLLIV